MVSLLPLVTGFSASPALLEIEKSGGAVTQLAEQRPEGGVQD